MQIKHRIPQLFPLFLFLLLLLAGCSAGKPLAADWASNLDGPWELYWNRLVPPQILMDGTAGEPDGWISSNEVWNFLTVPNKAPGPYGNATYHLVVRVPEGSSQAALFLPRIAAAYQIFINGEPYGGFGIPGTTQAGSVGRMGENLILFPVDRGQVDLVLHISNFDDAWGGILGHPRLGSPQRLLGEEWLKTFLLALILGAIGMTILTQLQLLFSKARGKASLAFVFLCITLGIKTIFDYRGFLLNGVSFLGWNFLSQCEFLVLFLAMAAFLFYLKGTFPGEVPKAVIGGSFGLLAIYTAALFSLEPRYFLILMVVFQVQMVGLWGYSIFLAGRAVLRKQPGALSGLLGFLSFFVSILLDMLSIYGMIPDSVPFTMPVGLLLFILFQSFAMFQDYAKNKQKSEQLTLLLGEHAKNLEEKVKNRTEALERVHREQLDFFVKLAHETRTPLTLILNHLDGFLTKNPATPELRIIRENFLKLQRDMMNYLDMDRLLDRDFHFDHGQVMDLVVEAKESVQFFLPQAEKKGLSLSVEGEASAFIRFDPSALQRILNNLVDNAIKFTQAGRIVLEIRAEDGQVVLLVRDTGIGISSEECEQVFEPFHQVTSTGKGTEGFGMGLAIVKKILIDAGQSIAVTSRLGRGTEFQVTFTPSAEPPQAVSPKGSAVILLVEDSADMRGFLAQALGQHYQVVTAENGLRAKSALQQGLQPDIILSDIMMDGMTGKELFEWTRSQPAWSSTPFLFMTALGSLDDRLMSYAVGVHDVMTKPFHVRELIGKVRSLLELRTRSRQEGLAEASRLIASRLQGEAIPSAPPALPSQEPAERLFSQYQITSRQKEIIALLCRGLEYKEIAHELNLSVHTVDRHVQNLYAKVGAHNKVELVQRFSTGL